MTRKGSSKTVDGTFSEGRLILARAYLKAARDELSLANPGDIANPAMSQIVNAAIAFGDALTAAHGERANRQDHSAAVKMLRDLLGNRLPNAQETNLRRILAEKDASIRNTAPRQGRRQVLLARHEEFAAWAEAELSRRR